MNERVFGCPHCGNDVEGRGLDWFCTQCQKLYPTTNGITDFRCARRDYYFNPVPRDAMARLCSPDTEQSWDDRVRTFLAHTGWNPDWLDNLVADGRYAWKVFLELPEGARVLDLGCGLGNLTKNLAPNVGVAYAMDLTTERLEFARLRFSEFNRDDRIKLLAGGDGSYLPFADNSLDAVFLSGVLEWIPDDDSLWDGGSKVSKVWKMLASQFGATNPRRQQLVFLRDIRRVLRPEGQLFVAIENRLNYEYFFGRPDHHSALKFGALMPRLLANLYSILRNKRPYRTYTHSNPGYRRLLSQAGFQDCELIGLLPGYSKLSELVPLQTRIPNWETPPGKSLKRRMASHPLFAPAFGIVASSEPRPRLIERLRTRIEHESRLGNEPLIVSHYFVTGKDKGVLLAHGGGTRLAIKLPFNTAATEAEERNRSCLVSFGEAYPLAPQAISTGEVSGVRYFVEHAVEGRSVRASFERSLDEDLLGNVSQALALLNPDLTRSVVEVPTQEEIANEIQRPLDRLVEALDGEERARSVADIVHARLHRFPARRGLTHGDFGAHNVFVQGSRVTGIIDWENSARTIPAMDAVNLLDSVHRLRDPNATISDTVVLLATGKWPSQVEADFLAEQLERSGISADDTDTLVAYYWLRHVGSQLRHHARYDVTALRRRLESFFDYALTQMRPALAAKFG